MKKLIYFVGIVLLAACSQEKKLLRKAATAVEQSDFEKAVKNYDELLKKNPDSYFGNAGKGIVLSEYMGKHEQAIPYLEKALEKSPRKTQTKLNTDLGVSYHYIGNYQRAIYYFTQALPNNNEDNADYDAYLTKRIADCKYALAHPEVAPAEEQWVKNIGKPINTEMPEYSPVVAKGDLIFTSQRRDNPKEKRNGVDGKYFENMYISKMKDGQFTTPERFTLPNYSKNNRFNRHNESILSASADNKTIFLYRDGKIFEANLNDSLKEAHKLSNTINFATLQNHASLSPDGKTLFFTSESDKGIGGTDIYYSTKGEDGDWSAPQLMGFNTMYNEDSPYAAANDVLFFSSNGLPGYGGFDVYVTRFENGKWSTPENIGQPINSPGDDIYFTLKPGRPDGYYASSRMGGMGDMDIYQVHYVMNRVKDCTPSPDIMAINSAVSENNAMSYNFDLKLPEGMQKKVRSYTWTINNEPIMQTSTGFNHTFDGPGTYTIAAKTVVYCDTCTSLVSYCSEQVVNVSDVKPLPVAANDSKSNAAEKSSKENKKVTRKNKQEKNSSAKEMKETVATEVARAESSKGNEFLSDDELMALKWNKQPSYFAYNDYALNGNAKQVLDENIGVLKNNQTLFVVIKGYADSRGSEAYNKTLSLKRAQAVKDYLVENGVSGKKIIAVKGMGETELLNNCDDNTECSEEQHQVNRRVEISVTNRNRSNVITLK